MGLQWKCCPGEGEQPSVSRRSVWLRPSGGDKEGTGLCWVCCPGWGHLTCLLSSTFLLSWNCFQLTSGTFFCNQQHFLSQSRAFCDRGIPTVWDQPEKRGRFWLHFSSLFPIMWSVSEVSVMPHLSPLKNLKFLRGIEQVQGFTRNHVCLWDSKSYCTGQCWGHSDRV